MKVQIKDLKPNPFRDMENYPIDRGKVQALINSIDETGFWDNILARKNNSKMEIAYGHHRLVALQEYYKDEPDKVVDVPVKKLNDEKMIKIMANENNESWGTSTKVIDETVRVTKKFLEEHTEIALKYFDKGSLQLKKYKRELNNDLFINKSLLIGSPVLSRFLGKNWSQIRVASALQRLRLYGKELDKEAVESLPTERASRDFVEAVKSVKVTFKQQRKIAKKIVESRKKDTEEKGIYGVSAIKSVLLDEKFRDKKTIEDEEERYGIQYRDIVLKTTRDSKILNEDLEEYFVLRDRISNFGKYIKKYEADNFTFAIKILRDKLNEYIKGEKENEEDKLYQINNQYNS